MQGRSAEILICISFRVTLLLVLMVSEHFLLLRQDAKLATNYLLRMKVDPIGFCLILPNAQQVLLLSSHSAWQRVIEQVAVI